MSGKNPDPNRASSPRVALLIETSMAYGRDILHGVAQYLRENGPWTVFFEHRSLQDPAPPWLADWDGDGIITTLFPQFGHLIAGTGIPTIDLDDQRPISGLPTVQSHQEAIGALAAEHLLERGFTRFAFLGYPEFEWSRRRWLGFEGKVRAAGFACDEYLETQPVTWGHQQAAWETEIHALAHWIARFPKPLGLMACNDYRGIQLLGACRHAGIAVPEEVAVIGVDNDILACELAYPPLSSVVPDCRRIGYEAAAMLDRIMRKEPVHAEHPEVPPYGIVTRQSTDITAISDPLLAEAMHFIRRRACAGIQVEDVLEHVSTSRSVLQRRFRAGLGRSIHSAITLVRLQRAKQLLNETDLALPDIAERTGFSSVEYLSTWFRKSTGTSPGVYRKKHKS
ncbi:substrate-binding domain-containing protein [Singulisphaera sp. PoT]|uniref:AraC family transcriptional regulator n=1 Tax=Singulisphaera sp. PoT TaxID=3411797 RepID=UPI003BF58F2B